MSSTFKFSDTLLGPIGSRDPAELFSPFPLSIGSIIYSGECSIDVTNWGLNADDILRIDLWGYSNGTPQSTVHVVINGSETLIHNGSKSNNDLFSFHGEGQDGSVYPYIVREITTLADGLETIIIAKGGVGANPTFSPNDSNSNIFYVKKAGVGDWIPIVNYTSIHGDSETFVEYTPDNPTLDFTNTILTPASAWPLNTGHAGGQDIRDVFSPFGSSITKHGYYMFVNQDFIVDVSNWGLLSTDILMFRVPGKAVYGSYGNGSADDPEFKVYAANDFTTFEYINHNASGTAAEVLIPMKLGANRLTRVRIESGNIFGVALGDHCVWVKRQQDSDYLPVLDGRGIHDHSMVDSYVDVVSSNPTTDFTSSIVHPTSQSDMIGGQFNEIFAGVSRNYLMNRWIINGGITCDTSNWNLWSSDKLAVSTLVYGNGTEGNAVWATYGTKEYIIYDGGGRPSGNPDGTFPIEAVDSFTIGGFPYIGRDSAPDHPLTKIRLDGEYGSLHKYFVRLKSDGSEENHTYLGHFITIPTVLWNERLTSFKVKHRISDVGHLSAGGHNTDTSGHCIFVKKQGDTQWQGIQDGTLIHAVGEVPPGSPAQLVTHSHSSSPSKFNDIVLTFGSEIIGNNDNSGLTISKTTGTQQILTISTLDNKVKIQGKKLIISKTDFPLDWDSSYSITILNTAITSSGNVVMDNNVEINFSIGSEASHWTNKNLGELPTDDSSKWSHSSNLDSADRDELATLRPNNYVSIQNARTYLNKYHIGGDRRTKIANLNGKKNLRKIMKFMFKRIISKEFRIKHIDVTNILDDSKKTVYGKYHSKRLLQEIERSDLIPTVEEALTLTMLGNTPVDYILNDGDTHYFPKFTNLDKTSSAGVLTNLPRSSESKAAVIIKMIFEDNDDLDKYYISYKNISKNNGELDGSPETVTDNNGTVWYMDSTWNPITDPDSSNNWFPMGDTIELQPNKGLIVTKDALGTASTPFGATGADPYINPIYGRKYKLPDKGDIYRFLDNNVKSNRFLINIGCWDLPNTLKNEMHQYMYEVMKIRYNLKTKEDINEWLTTKNISIDKSAVFIRYLFIYNNNDYILFDLEKFSFINPNGDVIDNNNIPNCFVINNDISNVSELNIKAYDQIIPNKILEINTTNKTYGKITLYVMKYNNPQIRNAYNIITEIPITKETSRGALLGNQDIENIKVNAINNINEIKEFKHTNNDKSITELFVDEYGKESIERW